jgi:IMP dehydrogenase/GMP reductase
MNNKIKLGYDDVSIVPERVTDIRHRKECIYKDMNTLSLPIFTAPMDNVIDIESMSTYINNNINTVLPRTISFDERLHLMISYSYDKKMFFAFSLNEVQELFLKDLKTIFKKDIVLKIRKNLNSKYFEGSYNICIDIANGHMLELIDTIKSIKNIYGDKITIMAGNIANPETYRDYENAGCDYVRCSIGSGSRCTTSSNVSIHYGCFSLIKEIWEIKKEINGKCKIIADGGIKGYGDIQKALLYADYVMIGGLFNKAIDSAGTPTYGKSYWNFLGKKIINPFKTLFTYGKKVKKKNYAKVLKLIKEGKLDVWKEYYGMSSKIAQRKISSNAKLKTSEGKVQPQKVEYSIEQWVENEIDYLCSAMSYTNSRTLKEYQNSQWIQLTYKSYNK